MAIGTMTIHEALYKHPMCATFSESCVSNGLLLGKCLYTLYLTH